MQDVPRNAFGWPTVKPKFFTLPQLVREAKRWRGDRLGVNTVGSGEWAKYTRVLIKRGFSTATEIQEGILPDEVPRTKKPKWLGQLHERDVNHDDT